MQRLCPCHVKRNEPRVWERVLQLVDDEFAVFLFLDQAFRDLALLRHKRPVVLDPPDGEAADHPEDQQQGKPGSIGQGAAEIDDHAEQTAGQRSTDADP